MPQVATFEVPALDCPDEMSLIEHSLPRVAGIDRLSPDYFSRTLRVEYDAAVTDPAAIMKSLSDAGFQSRVKSDSPQLNVIQRTPTERPTTPPRLVLVGGVLLVVAAMAWWLAGGFTAVVVVLAIASTVLSGAPVAHAAWRAVRLRALDMNVLMTVAAAGAIGIGDYFEAATAMFLFGASLWLERLSLARARGAIRSLIELTPSVAHRLAQRDRVEEAIDVNPASLAVGDYVLVRPGERIPADGEVVSGESAVNQAPITGESVPVAKRAGDRLFAGTLNGEGSLIVVVTRAAHDSTLARISRMVDEARSARSPTERFVDRFARRYTPAVIAVALALMIVPPVLGHFGVVWAADVSVVDWIHRGLVLLVVACPCALVISTPVTIVSGLHQATRLGILVKGGEFLEKAGTIRCVALDKTGTLTTGTMEVVAVQTFNGYSSDQVLGLAAALERHSEHPLARAITSAADERGLAPASAGAVTSMRGLGLVGEIEANTYYLGNARLFAQPQFRLAVDDAKRLSMVDQMQSPSDLSNSLAWLGTTERLLGLIRIADSPRGGTREAIDLLRRQGIERIAMLTGDNAAAANSIAAELGIDEVYADLLPQDKIERVRKMAAECRLMMVGDGVNDAPALAAADVGVALGGQSSDTAIETADVVVMTPELSKVASLIRLSRRCRRLLKQNVAFALGSKVVVLLLAAAGLGTMWMAVAADVGASLIVIANGMRIIRPTGDG